MTWVKEFSQISKEDVRTAGGKGASLGEMTRVGIPVPTGFVISAEAFRCFLEESDVGVEINSILGTVKIHNMETVECASEKIQALILGEKSFPKDLETEVFESLKKLDVEYVAVRSSATAEDSASAAWAGQLDTFLNIAGPELIENIKKCWASLFTPRAIFYRFEKQLEQTQISVAVVVQSMVQSDIAGVAFSVHPVTEDTNQMIIEAAQGLGEAVVSGEVTPDSYVATKNPRKILDKNVRVLKTQLLTDTQIFELVEMVLKIENHYGFPCDVEWALKDGTFYILQSRPITTLSTRRVEVGAAAGIMRMHKEAPLNAKAYQKLFQWPGEFSYFLSSYFMGVYNKHHAISLHDGQMWQSFIPLTVREETLKEGLELYGSAELYASLRRGLTTGFDELKLCFEDVLAQDIVTKEGVRAVIDQALQHYTFYSKTEFFFTDLAFEHSADNLQIQKNFEDFDALKLRGRESLNAIALVPNCFLDRLLTKIGSQVGLEIAVLKNYTVDEVFSLFDGKRVDRSVLIQRQTYFNQGMGDHFDSTVGEDAIRKVNTFLGEVSHSHELIGQVASRGHYSGRARVLRFAIKDISTISTQIEAMEYGEILVADTTAPEIILACKKAGAIVTNQGGMMSHAAIVSRELKIPCVVGTGYATEIIKTGDLVVVDAHVGVVRIEKSVPD